jgi:hypothetical protein
MIPAISMILNIIIIGLSGIESALLKKVFGCLFEMRLWQAGRKINSIKEVIVFPVAEFFTYPLIRLNKKTF